MLFMIFLLLPLAAMTTADIAVGNRERALIILLWPNWFVNHTLSNEILLLTRHLLLKS